MKNLNDEKMKVITLELTLSDVNTIVEGLGELPAKVSFNSIENIRAQVQRQIQANQKTEKEQN